MKKNKTLMKFSAVVNVDGKNIPMAMMATSEANARDLCFYEGKKIGKKIKVMKCFALDQ